MYDFDSVSNTAFGIYICSAYGCQNRSSATGVTDGCKPLCGTGKQTRSSTIMLLTTVAAKNNFFTYQSKPTYPVFT